MDLPLPDLARPPVAVLRPDRQSTPLVFVSAHSGTEYPPEFLRGSRLDPVGLRRSEDCFVDELFAAAPRCGAPLLAAKFPRAFCDANREKWELDPSMFHDDLPPWVNTGSARVTAGLGTIARVVASGEAIYRAKLPFAEAVLRIEACWQGFHDALDQLITETRQRFGVCLVVDCHSMPSAGVARPAVADVVLGDAHGTTCAPAVMRYLEQAFGRQGRTVRRNDPYAGGFITRHYGRPREAVHAVQVEVARALYMDEAKVEKLAAFDRLRADLTVLVAELARDAPDLLGKKVAAP
jgi:N-formylglutamate amidohydrolase